MRNLSKMYIINGLFYLQIDEFQKKDNPDEVKLMMANDGFINTTFNKKELDKNSEVTNYNIMKKVAIKHNETIMSKISGDGIPSYVYDSGINSMITHIMGKELISG